MYVICGIRAAGRPRVNDSTGQPLVFWFDNEASKPTPFTTLYHTKEKSRKLFPDRS